MALSWIKKGADSAAMAKQEEVEAQKRKEEQGKLFRFWLEKGSSAKVTFVDGDLNEEGQFLPPRYYEHSILIGGKWENYVCPEKTNPQSGDKCPICASGDRPSLVALFTVIDHRTWTNKDKTKTYQDQKRLLVAKSQSTEILNKIAVKRGGLAGARFEISRTGEKSPQIGDMFDFEEKLPIDQLRAKYMQERTDPKTNTKSKVTYFTPADYESEIVFRDGKTLAAMGLGVPQPQSSIASPGGSSAPPVDYSNQL